MLTIKPPDMINRNPYLQLTFALLPFVYLSTIYAELPARIPLHFDWLGNPDAWGPKWMLWLIPLTGVFLTLLVNAAIRLGLPAEDIPAKHQSVGMITLAFISLLLCYIIYGTKAGGFDGLGGISILLGLLFGALGNYLPVLRPNPFIGIRVPPTLNSEDKWRKTHRYAGPLFILGGALLVLNGFLFEGGTITIAMLIIIGVIAILPIVYAYRLPDVEDGPYV